MNANFAEMTINQLKEFIAEGHFAEMTLKQLNAIIAENDLQKPRGRLNKDDLIAHIIHRLDVKINFEKSQMENIQMGREDINRAIPAVVVEEEEEEFFASDDDEEEESEEEETDNYRFNDCEDCGNEFDNEGNPALRFCENCDDHHPHNETEEESEEEEEEEEEEKSCGFGDCEKCGKDIYSDGHIGHHTETGAICRDCDAAAPAEEEEPIFNGDRCPVCLDEECSTYTDTCEHMLCGGCFDMLPEKNWVGNGWMPTNPVRECPICRSICRGVKEGQTSNSDKIREWRDLKKRIAEYEAGKAHIQVCRVVQRVVVNAEGQEVALGGGGQPPARRRGNRANAARMVGQMNAVAGPARPAGRNAEVVLAEGAVLGDIHFDARPRLRCRGTDNGDGGNAVACSTNTRRVCPQCRNKRLCLACGDRCADCLA